MDELLLPNDQEVEALVRAQGNIAEHRQVTALFCDIVRSTELSQQLDPDDYWRMLRGYKQAVRRLSREADGTVCHHKGDGILVCFGYPSAHDDDAYRAVTVALALLDHFADGPGAAEGLRLRIGVATGDVAIYDDHESHPEPNGLELMGPIPALCARLQAIAGERTVLTDRVTFQLTENDFDYADAISTQLKGFPGLIACFRPLVRRRLLTRFEQRGPALHPFVNRLQERAVMNDAWEEVGKGRGRVVCVTGDAGIGKSRLVHAFFNALDPRSFVEVRLQCSQMHTRTALHPFAVGIARLIGLNGEALMEAKLRILRDFLARIGIRDRHGVALLAQLVGLRVNDEPDAALSDLQPEDIRVRTNDLVAACLAQMSRRRPLVCIIEDAHWADPTSLGLILELAEKLATLPVMIVVTSRATAHGEGEALARLLAAPSAVLLQLAKLSRIHAVEIASNIAGMRERAEPLSPDWITHIIERSDGVPLFIEELTRSVIEQRCGGGAGGEPDSGGNCAGAGKPTLSHDIPATLRALLAARLDALADGAGRLVSPRRIAQLAACLGREFSSELLKPLARSLVRHSEGCDAALEAALARLCDADLVYRTHRRSAVYRFRHGLVQDEAYASLWRDDKKSIHAHIVNLLLPGPANVVADAAPELIALHASLAGRPETAAQHWMIAGKRAAGRSSLSEARHHFEEILKLADKIPTGARRDHLKLEALVALSAVLMAEKGFTAPEVARCLDRATALGQRLGPQDPLYIPALLGKQLTLLVSGQHRIAVKMGVDGLRLARLQNETAYEIAALRHLGASLFWAGRPRDACRQLSAVEDLYNGAEHSDLSILYASDPRAGALAILSLALALLGRVEDAHAASAKARLVADDLGHTHTQGYVLLVRAMLLDLLRAPETGEAAAHTIDFCRGHSLPFWGRWAQVLYGHAEIRAGKAKSGTRLVRHSMAAFRKTGAGIVQTYFHSLLAEGLALTANADDAVAEIRHALVLVKRNHERMYEAELWRVLAMLLQWTGAQAAEVEANFERALNLARRQGALLFEARAALDFAGWLDGQGRGAQARRVILASRKRCKRTQSSQEVAALEGYLMY